MTIDLSAVPTLTDNLGLYDIPLQRDTFPYAQLQAQGRYPDRSTPNTLPEFLSTLNATDRNFNPDMPSTDSSRNLNVRIAGSDIPIGGGSTQYTAYASGNSGVSCSAGRTTLAGTFPHAPAVLYSVDFDIVLTAVTDGVHPFTCELELGNSGAPTIMWLGAASFLETALTTSALPRVHGSRSWPAGFLLGALGDATTTIKAHCVNTGTVRVTFALEWGY